MSKADFFRELHERLRCLPEQEQQRIIGVYEDLFRQAEANGKSEREIVASLEHSPSCCWYATVSERCKQEAESGFRTLVAALALVLFNLIFVLGPALAIVAVLFALSFSALLLILSPVWILAGTGMPATANLLLLEIFVSMAGIGLGLLLSAGMWFVNHAFFLFAKAYVNMNLRLIRGE